MYEKIIIIEDDKLLNKTLAYNLISDGYNVISAYTCSAARGLLKNNYNLVLLDINLPDASGLDLCIEIKKRSPETYIMFLTANDKESDMLKGYEVGGADYITKPFSVAVLCSKAFIGGWCGCSADICRYTPWPVSADKQPHTV